MADNGTSPPPFGTPEYTKWYYNDPAGPGYIPGQGRTYTPPKEHPGRYGEKESIATQERPASTTGVKDKIPPAREKPGTQPSQERQQTATPEYTQAMEVLKPYEVKPGQFDIQQFMLDAESPGYALTTLKNAGFDKEAISAAAKGNLAAAEAARAEVKEKYSGWGVTKYSANLVAEMVVPFYGTVKHWDELEGWEKVIYPALDVAIIIPAVGLAGKAVGGATKTVSSSAKITALGGREAVEIAAKDATQSLEKSLAQRSAQRALLESAVEASKTADQSLKTLYKQAVKAAEKDLALTEKQIAGLTKDVNKLQALSKEAQTVSGTGSKVLRATEKVEKVTGTGRVADIAGKGGGAAISGVTAYNTIANWNELSPTQRAAGVAISLLPIGGFGKAKNLVENVADPYKIPKKAVTPRAVPKKAPEVGAVFNPTGDNTLRLTISDAKKLKDMDFKQARVVVQDLMDQATKGEMKATATLKGKEVKLKGTGFQKTVSQEGHTAFSGSPTGEVFKEGTGAFGIKTNLEKYLEKINQKRTTPIEIESKPYKVLNPETGKMETVRVSTVSTPGVTVKGSEGGLYLGPGLHTRFSRTSAAGIKGGISSGVIVGYEDIAKLPRKVAREALAGNEMREAAIKYFDGSRGSGQIVEGFKKFGRIMEFENVATNGTQISRVRNLRSKLKVGKGEYYTRDSQGKLELFQMYVEGGRATPYTLKELYQLKGYALRNSIVDLGVGLKNKLRELKNRKPTPKEAGILTKEEKILNKMSQIDRDVKAGKIRKSEALDIKRQAIDDIRFEESVRKFTPEERIRFNADPVVKRTNARVIKENTRAQQDRLYRAEETVRQLQRTPRAEEVRTGKTRAAERTAESREPSRQPRETTTRETTAREAEDRGGEERPPEDRQARETPDRETPPRDTTPRGRVSTPGRESEKEEEKKKTTKPVLPTTEMRQGKADFPKGTVAWKQGIGWWVFVPPYTGPEDRLFILKKPRGAEIATDAKTAAGTIQSMGGPSAVDFKFDMGIVDVDLKSPPRRPNRPEGRKAIRFKLDTEGSYGGKGTSAKTSGSQRVGPYHYKDGALSKKPL
jgi:hypothetical protein